MFDAGQVGELPDVIVRPGGFPQDRRPRLVATGYGGSVRGSFSGSSAYLTDAGIDNGSLDGAFTLLSDRRPERALEVKGAVWKAQRLLHRESSKGFKYSDEFSAHLWHRYQSALAGADIINNYQLYSAEFFERRASFDIGGYFYIDGTLHDYLRGYSAYDVARIDSATTDRAIEVERHGYEQADGVAVMSEFVANTLVSEYGLARDRITVVLPGANLTDAMAETVIAARKGRAEPAAEYVIGFVGLYPERKGLPKLAAAVDQLRRDNVPVRLQAIGRCPDDIAAMDGVDALGVINKTTEPGRFADALARIDLGCQLSTAELSAIALLEFFRCGIPILTTEVGGIPDALRAGGGIGLPSDVPVDAVAAAIRNVIDDKAERRRLESEAEDRSDQARWHHTAAAIGDFVARTRNR